MIALGALLALTACGEVVGGSPSTPTPTAPAATPANSGYLVDSTNMGGDGSWVIFWDGSASTLYQSQREGNQIGTLNGQAMRQGSSFETLVQHGGQADHTPDLLGSGTFAVTDKANGFELTIPWSDGTVHAYDFRPGSLTDYNADVGKMQQQIQADQAAARQAQQQAQQAQEQQQQAQQQQALQQLQQLQQKEATACAGIGGHVTGASHPTTALCVPNNQGPSEKPGNNCSSPTVGFNSDGTLDQGSLNDARQNDPGCFL